MASSTSSKNAQEGNSALSGASTSCGGENNQAVYLAAGSARAGPHPRTHAQSGRVHVEAGDVAAKFEELFGFTDDCMIESIMAMEGSGLGMQSVFAEVQFMVDSSGIMNGGYYGYQVAALVQWLGTAFLAAETAAAASSEEEAAASRPAAASRTAAASVQAEASVEAAASTDAAATEGAPAAGATAPAAPGPCHFFRNGRCRSGASCYYRHEAGAAALSVSASEAAADDAAALVTMRAERDAAMAEVTRLRGAPAATHAALPARAAARSTRDQRRNAARRKRARD